jgi:hypothetical protein
MGPICFWKPDGPPDDGWRIPMKALILAILISVSVASAQAAAYHAPSYNYYQLNWMAD